MLISFMDSDRLEFRGPEIADIEILARWVNDPSIRLFLDHRVFPMSQLAEETWVRNMCTQSAPRTDVVFLARKKGEERAIGCAGLHGINWISRSAEFGILLESSEQNQGYGREISAQLLAYAFRKLNLNRVYLRVCALHTRAIKCYENAGYVREGVTRQSFYIDGKYEDTVLMAVLRENWVG
jgi:RimJ/RimL family protein N-acetyltransferase